MYFGKPVQLTRVEDYIDELKLKYGNPNKIKYKELLRDPIFKKIAEQFTDLFGFKESIVTVSNSMVINAYVITAVIDDKGNMFPLGDKIIRPHEVDGVLKITNGGFKIITKKYPTNLTIVITYGCFTLPTLTTKELVAILMHEIGHQFSYIIARVQGDMADEKFADGFASLYGYGPELVSALKKITIRDDVIDRHIKDVPILNFFYGLTKIVNTFDSDGVHPHLMSRVNHILRQMEYDLENTPMSAEARKDLEKQVKNIKDYIKDNFDSNPNDNIGAKMLKYHLRTQPDGFLEKRWNDEADKKIGPKQLDDKLKKYKKKKGYFI
jgi:hypothetical protein